MGRPPRAQGFEVWGGFGYDALMAAGRFTVVKQGSSDSKQKASPIKMKLCNSCFARRFPSQQLL